ncbi:MAG: glycogen synthase [Alkalispirochaetaceae bacterium]
MDNAIKVLMVSSEYASLAKEGGLADAVASLSGALRRIGLDVRVVMPRYGFIPKGKLEPIPGSLGVPIGIREEWVGVYRYDAGEIPVYLLDHEELFGRHGIYNESGLDYADNPRRFTLLSYGALQLCRMLHWTPDVIHAHDWPGGLVPLFLQTRERRGAFEKTASCFTIHNIGYQGIFAPEQFVHTRLSWEEYSIVDFHGSFNILFSAIRSADAVTTVSPRYAREILDPEFSFGLHHTLAARGEELQGILNGIDLDIWDPESDEALPKPFSVDDLSGKGEAKRELQRRFGLPEEEGVPLVGFIGRLAEHKGVRHLFDEPGGAAGRLCREEDIQIVALGSGDPQIENQLRELSLELPNFGAYLGYDDELAHLIEGGADFLLIPSEYEPCGLNQMYSMRYGTIPITTDTGGLADTVVDESAGVEATGFLFARPTIESIVAAVQRAVTVYREDPGRIESLRKAGMERDFSWDRSARAYRDLYEEAIRRRRRA